MSLRGKGTKGLGKMIKKRYDDDDDDDETWTHPREKRPKQMNEFHAVQQDECEGSRWTDTFEPLHEYIGNAVKRSGHPNHLKPSVITDFTNDVLHQYKINHREPPLNKQNIGNEIEEYLIAHSHLRNREYRQCEDDQEKTDRKNNMEQAIRQDLNEIVNTAPDIDALIADDDYEPEIRSHNNIVVATARKIRESKPHELSNEFIKYNDLKAMISDILNEILQQRADQLEQQRKKASIYNSGSESDSSSSDSDDSSDDDDN